MKDRASGTSRVMHANILAANGYIHFMDSYQWTAATTAGDTEVSPNIHHADWTGNSAFRIRIGRKTTKLFFVSSHHFDEIQLAKVEFRFN